jgi:hypothetical protein
VVEAHNWRRFRQPVSFQYAHGERFLELAKDLDRHGRPSRGTDAQVLADRSGVHPARRDMLQQGPVHRRDADPELHLLADDRLEDVGGIEPGVQDDAEAAVEPGVHLTGLGRGMEERQRDERHILFQPPAPRGQQQVARGGSIGQHVLVRQLRPLRVTGRP